jgi:hypothetical protein
MSLKEISCGDVWGGIIDGKGLDQQTQLYRYSGKPSGNYRE